MWLYFLHLRNFSAPTQRALVWVASLNCRTNWGIIVLVKTHSGLYRELATRSIDPSRKRIVFKFSTHAAATVLIIIAPALLAGCAARPHLGAAKAFDQARPVALLMEHTHKIPSVGYLAPRDVWPIPPLASNDATPPGTSAIRTVTRPSPIWHKKYVDTVVSGRSKVEFKPGVSPAQPASLGAGSAEKLSAQVSSDTKSSLGLVRQ